MNYRLRRVVRSLSYSTFQVSTRISPGDLKGLSPQGLWQPETSEPQKPHIKNNTS